MHLQWCLLFIIDYSNMGVARYKRRSHCKMNAMYKEYKISLCTICMNRLYHLRETLPRNIEDNLSYHDLEHIVLDYNSKDGMEQWVREHFATYIDTGRLKYFRTPDPEKFNMTHSKNMVSKLASGEIICLVDADNYTGRDYAKYVNHRFNKQPDIFLTTIAARNVKNKPDVLGRICFWKSDFLTIAGFDEFMSNYGFDDHDFANRLTLSGRRRVVITNETFLQAITHTIQERLENQKVSTDFDSLFIRHLHPAASELLFLFTDHSFSLGIIKDNHTKAALSLKNLLRTGRHKYKMALATEDWIQGTWATGNSVLYLYLSEKKDHMVELTIEQNLLLSKNNKKCYFKLENDSNVLDMLFFHTLVRNRNKMTSNLRQRNMVVNHSGFGSGRVFLNFNNNVPIDI